MKNPKSLFILLGITALLALIHFYGKGLQQEWRRSQMKKSRLSHLRLNASLVPTALPKPRKKEFSAQDSGFLGSDPLEIANNYLLINKSEFDIQAYHEPRGTVYKTPLGSTVKYTFYQDGLPLVGMHLSVEIGEDNIVRDVDNNYRPLPRAEFSEEDFLKADEMASIMPERFHDKAASYKDSRPVLYVTPMDEPVLSYVVRTRDRGRDKPIEVVMRAEDGQILNYTTPRNEF